MSTLEDGEGAKWLSAHSEPDASLRVLPSCMSLADLNGDGDYKLVLADLGSGQFSMKLKVLGIPEESKC